jgi:hypothetical protein
MTTIQRDSKIVVTDPDTGNKFVAIVTDLPHDEETLDVTQPSFQNAYLMSRVKNDPDFQTESSIPDGTFKTVQISNIDVDLTEEI